MSTVKEKIKGGFDLLFLFGRGIKPFEAEGTKAHALKSLWIPVLLYPLTPLFSYYYPPLGMHDKPYPYSQILLSMTAQYILSIGIIALAGWLYGVAFNVREKFWLYFQTINWVSIPLLVVTLPFALAAVTGYFDREELDRVFVIVNVYMIFVTGCIALRAFGLNWQLAGMLACMTMFLNQQVWNIIFWVQGIPLVWTN